MFKSTDSFAPTICMRLLVLYQRYMDETTFSDVNPCLLFLSVLSGSCFKVKVGVRDGVGFRVSDS